MDPWVSWGSMYNLEKTCRQNMKLKLLFSIAIATFLIPPGNLRQAAYGSPPLRPLPPQTSPTTPANQPTGGLPCYLVTDSGYTVDLSDICGQIASPAPVIIYPPAPNVYDQDAIDAFNDSWYGPD